MELDSQNGACGVLDAHLIVATETVDAIHGGSGSGGAGIGRKWVVS